MVFRAVERACAASPLTHGGTLSAVAAELGFHGLDWEEFAAGDGVAGALMTVLWDLGDYVGVIDFKNVAHGNGLSILGRDLLPEGPSILAPELRATRLQPRARTLLRGLVAPSEIEHEAWAQLVFVDPVPIYREL